LIPVATQKTVPNLTLSQDAQLYKYVRLPSGWKYLRADYSKNFGVKHHSVFLPKTNTLAVVEGGKYVASDGGNPLLHSLCTPTVHCVHCLRLSSVDHGGRFACRTALDRLHVEAHGGVGDSRQSALRAVLQRQVRIRFLVHQIAPIDLQIR